MPDQYVFSISIVVPPDETKKNTVRDNIYNQLLDARTKGLIVSALISITRTVVPETVTLSPI